VNLIVKSEEVHCFSLIIGLKTILLAHFDTIEEKSVSIDTARVATNKRVLDSVVSALFYQRVPRSDKTNTK